MHLRIILALSLASLAAACGSTAQNASTTTTTTASSSASAAEQAGVPTISVDDVAEAIGRADGSIVVFDANSRETYAEHHVPGATWIQYDAINGESLPQDLGKRLVFYCGGEQCSAAPQAARQAMEMGYTNVAVMSAGIRGWLAAGKPTESTPPQPQ